MDSQDSIGQAKGILVERFKVDGEEAFQMLVKPCADCVGRQQRSQQTYPGTSPPHLACAEFGRIGVVP